MTLKGGDKLEKVLAQLGGVDNGYVSAGFLANAKYSITGTPVAMVAFWNEFGHGGPFPAPPRPFMRPAVDNDAKEWVAVLGSALKSSDYNAEQALGIAGKVMAESIQAHIREVDAPPLSETTKILRQKFGMNTHEITASDVREAQREAAQGKTGVSGTGAKPLQHTGTLVRAVKAEVHVND